VATRRPYPILTRSDIQTDARGREMLAVEAVATSVRSKRSTLDREWRRYVVLLIVLDTLVVLLSLWLAYTVRISSGIVTYGGPSDLAAYRTLSLASLPMWLVLFAVFHLYRRDYLLGGTREYQQVLKACTAGIIGVILLSFLWRDQFVLVSRGWLIMAWTICTTLVMLERFSARRIGYMLRRRGHLVNRVLLVGANAQGLAMAGQWMQSPTSGMQVIGYLDDFKAIGTEVASGLKVLGRPRNLHELAASLDVDEVVVVPNAIAWETFEEIISNDSHSGDYVMRLSPGFYEIMATSVAVTDRSFVPLLTVHENRLVGVDSAVKSVLDIGLGAPLLLLALPAIAAAALVLKREDPELPWLETTPVLRSRDQTFRMLRLRTRRPDGSSSPFGQWLEETQLDRMPQLAHAVAGTMSLVGPQPQPLAPGEHDLRNTRSERTLKPGVIGPWSVWREWKPSEELSHDLYYVRNWTPWLDLQILFQAAALSARGIWRRASSPRRQTPTKRSEGRQEAPDA